MDRNVFHSTVEVDAYRLYGLNASNTLDFENRIKQQLIAEFMQALYKKATVTSYNDPMKDSKTFMAQVVILSLSEYRALLGSSNVQPLPTPAPISMDRVEEAAKEVLKQELQKSKTAQDYLMNRVRQLQNEHLLPKRKPD